MKRSYEMKKVSILTYKEKIKVVSDLLFDLKLIEFFESKHTGLEPLDKTDVEKESQELLGIRSAISQIKPYFTQMSGAYSNDSIDKIHTLINQRETLNQKIIQAKDIKLRETIKKKLKLTPKEIEVGYIGYVDKNKDTNLQEHKKKFRRTKTFGLNERVYFFSQEKPNFSYKEYFIPFSSSKKSELKVLEDKLKFIDKNITILANANLRHLQAQELKLSKELEVERAKDYFKESNKFIVIDGFVPSHKVHELDIALQQKLADSYEIEVERVKDNEEDIPVMLPNKGLLKSFEELISFYSFPKYREIDPSLLMLIFFPLFFGFILGDFGYGLVTFIVFSLLKNKFPDMKSLFSVMQLSSISSMAFGIFYGEYFGFEPKLLPFEFHRANHPETLLLIAVAFGLLHINMALIVGIINTIKHSLKKVFYDYVSWIILQIGVATIYFETILQIPNLTYAGYALILVAAILLYLGHGFQGVIEIPTLLTNVLSYARLMAVGLSSIAIAVLINDFSVPLLQGGIISAIFGIILITVGHLFNIALGNFESFLQSLRLHYVEFFSKFYEGGGREFKPFGSKLRDE